MTGITYGTLNMQDGGIYVTDTDVFSVPQKVIQAETLAETDGAVIVKATLRPKVFTVEGYLVADTVEGLDALRDTFLAALNLEQQNFDIDYNGSTRRYVATPQNITISRPKGLNSCGFSVEFFCAAPVGSDTTTSTLLASTTVTDANAAPAITVDGSYNAEPLITLEFTSITGGTAKTVAISNDTTLRGISVTRDWVSTDVLEIDCLNKTVYVNDTIVEYSGQFPRWDVGDGAIAYLDEFTTRSVNISATYTRRFL